MRRNAETGMKSSFKDEHEHPTLSRDLPLMIAVGKSDATCLTASRICEKKKSLESSMEKTVIQ
jgi:hypothetical protein